MKQHKRHSRGILPCESMGPEDGIDAHDLFRGNSRKKTNHKARQLCKQVMETINFLLAGDLDDARLQSVFVDEVTPAPDAARLLISVRQAFPQPDRGPADVLVALRGASGLIRCEVAGVVARKKVPELVFTVSTAWIHETQHIHVLPESLVPND